MLELSEQTKKPSALIVRGDQDKTYAWSIVQCFLFSLVIAAAAQVRIPLGFTPVPLTLQPLPILFTGMILGPTKGLFTVLLYILEGLCGLPVFAGGSSGFAYATGATGGYLVGYFAQVWLSGHLPRIYRSHSRFRGTLQALFVLILAICAQLSLGTLWLSRITGWEHCFTLGFAPFFLGDLGKAMIAFGYLDIGNRASATRDK